MNFKRGGILCHFMSSFATLFAVHPLDRENNESRNISSTDYLLKSFPIYRSLNLTVKLLRNS